MLEIGCTWDFLRLEVLKFFGGKRRRVVLGRCAMVVWEERNMRNFENVIADEMEYFSAVFVSICSFGVQISLFLSSDQI